MPTSGYTEVWLLLGQDLVALVGGKTREYIVGLSVKADRGLKELEQH